MTAMTPTIHHTHDLVLYTGIYSVVHDHAHHNGTYQYRLIFMANSTFPACNICGTLPTFILLQAAGLGSEHSYFVPPQSVEDIRTPLDLHASEVKVTAGVVAA